MISRAAARTGPAAPAAAAQRPRHRQRSAVGVGSVSVAGAWPRPASPVRAVRRSRAGRCRAAGPGGVVGGPAAGQAGGEVVEEVVVDPAGHDRGQRGVAVIAGPGVRPGQHRPVIQPPPPAPAAAAGRRGGRLAEAGRQPGAAGGADPVQELVQGQVQLQLDRLPGPVRAGCRRASSRRHASSRASCWRCGTVRMSSAPIFFPSESRTACSAAAQRADKSPVSRPAPPSVVSRCRPRRKNPSSPSPSGPQTRRRISSASSRQPRQVRAALSGGEQDHVRIMTGLGGQQVGPVGDLPRPRHRDRTRPRGRRRLRGGSASRRIQATVPRAAPAVTRVCQVSHDRADPCPSSSNPRCPANPASTLARAAVCIDVARSRPRRHSACTGAGSDPASAFASQPSPASTIRSAWLADDGSATSPPPGNGTDTGIHLLTTAVHHFAGPEPERWRKEGSGRHKRPGVMEEVSSPELPVTRLRVSYPAIEPVLEILTPATDNNRTQHAEAPIQGIGTGLDRLAGERRAGRDERRGAHPAGIARSGLQGLGGAAGSGRARPPPSGQRGARRACHSLELVVWVMEPVNQGHSQGRDEMKVAVSGAAVCQNHTLA